MITGSAENIFIVWAYAGIGIGTLGLIGWVWLSARRVDARLKTLEAQGIRRRSAAPANGPSA
jgi:hypothetical protein